MPIQLGHNDSIKSYETNLNIKSARPLSLECKTVDLSDFLTFLHVYMYQTESSTLFSRGKRLKVPAILSTHPHLLNRFVDI